MPPTVRGILFDAGDTLIRPVGGRWNPRRDFEEVLAAHVPDVRPELMAQAFAAGQRFLDDAPTTPNRDDYHRAILRELGIEKPSASLLADLDRPLDAPVVEPFPDVIPALDGLRSRGMRMAVVSDNWPGIEHLLEQVGLNRYFDAVVVSAVLGYRKPDPRIFRAGSTALDLEPPECLFVDDSPPLVSAALGLGYRGVVICRNEALAPADLPWIPRLDLLLAPASS